MVNIGIEKFLTKLTNGDETLLMLAAFALLVLISFVLEMWVEIKNKDLKWNDVTRFVKPIFLNAIFLFALEILMIPANRLPYGYDTINIVQNAGWLGFMGYYFVMAYKNLKQLGLKGNRKVDEAINELGMDEEEEE